MPTLLDLRQSHAKIIAQLEQLAAKPTLTGEDAQTFDRLKSEALETKNTMQRLEFLTAARAEVDAVEPVGRPAVDGPRETVKDRSRGYSDVRSFLRDVMNATQTRRVSKTLASLRPGRGYAVENAAGSDEHTTYDDPSLGFMVPETLLPGVWTMPAPADPFPDTLRLPMPTSTLRIVSRVDKDHSTSVSGGLRVYRRAQTQTVTPSKTQVERVELTAHELMGVTFETEELLADAPEAAMALIEAGFRDEFMSKRVSEIISGTGTGEYLGMDKCDAKIDIAKESGQAAATITFTNVVKMFARLWGTGRWVANKTCLPQLAAMNGGTNGLIWQPSARDGEPGTLLGLPLMWTEHCAAVGTVGDIRLCNMSQYLEGVRQDIQTAESIHVRFLENERTFRFTARTAGTPWWRSVLTPKNGDTLAPFIRLATRS